MIRKIKNCIMKKVILVLTLIGFVLSCGKDDNTNTNVDETFLIGTWRLVENLADPGDGSGVFLAVDSNKQITFNSDGTITSNGSLCDMSIQSETPTSGTYSSNLSFINSDDCINPNLNIDFTLENSTLTITYLCIEPCLSKYVKIE